MSWTRRSGENPIIIPVKGLKDKRSLHVDYATNDLYFSITIYIKAIDALYNLTRTESDSIS